MGFNERYKSSMLKSNGSKNWFLCSKLYLILPGSMILLYVSNSQALDNEYSIFIEYCLFLRTDDMLRS